MPDTKVIHFATADRSAREAGRTTGLDTNGAMRRRVTMGIDGESWAGPGGVSGPESPGGDGAALTGFGLVIEPEDDKGGTAYWDIGDEITPRVAQLDITMVNAARWEAMWESGDPTWATLRIDGYVLAVRLTV